MSSSSGSPPPRNPAPFTLRHDGSVPYENRGQLWLDDGDLIIVFHVDATAWKVSTEMLLNRAHKFRKILLDPRAHALGQQIEDCPMLSLLGGEKTAREVQRLLLLIHDQACIPNFRVTESFSVLEDIVRSTANYEAWYLFFDALRPLAYHYQARLAEFVHWDRTHDLPRPISPVHSLNLFSTAHDAFERFGDYRPGADAQTDTLFSLFSAGARLDLSLYMSEADLLAALKGRGVELRSEEMPFYRELVKEHRFTTTELLHDCEMFEDVDIESRHPDHLRCCGDVLRMTLRRLALTLGTPETTQRGAYFLNLIRALHTDSGRASMCEECLDDLDGLIGQTYDRWWRGVSPLIRGDMLEPEMYDDELDA
ncbi:hypothetical protein PENSPDRAFT_752755 [Peniophora sp. CONT]|nr:hypothetical protein PENSPDRAFT_752755 [Peniophora sp. CONT]